MTMGKDGKIGLFQGFSVPPGMGVEGSAEGQMQQAQLEAIRVVLKERATQGTIRAAALVDLVHFPTAEGPADVIRVQIEHEAAEPLICYLPYELKHDRWEQGEV
jgi:hypothetical protein